MFPMWLYFVAAAAIAAAAFAIGQLFPGLGVPFAALATTMWTAWSVYRQRKAAGRNC